MNNEIPEGVELRKITKTMHIRFQPNEYAAEGESKYSAFICTIGPYADGRDADQYLGTVDVDFEIPSDDRFFDTRTIEILKAKKQAIIAKSRAEQTEIDGQIQSLMALENLS